MEEVKTQCFNSKLVRLEAQFFSSQPIYDASFNSKLVRLEVLSRPSDGYNTVSIPNWFD